ncbi:MAG: penicillin-binding protein 2 [Elusimicrobiota bacterium]|nr:penicillin-binding protein 2 [Elusimicrobiota bacterium]
MNTHRRLQILFTIILLIPALLGIRLFNLQLWNRKKLTLMVEKQTGREKTYFQNRGLIYDRHMRLLAMNTKSISVAASPKNISNKIKFAENISQYIDLSKQEILTKLEENKSFVWLKRFVEKPNGIENLEVPGLIVLPEIRRYYPCKNVTAHVVGAVGIDGVGLSGVELFYDQLVGRRKFTEEFKCDGKRRQIKLFSVKENKVINIVLTIDTTLQYIAYKELLSAVNKYQPKKAIAIVQNPNTGEIFALVCYPDFNPNEFKFNSQLLLNPAVHEVFEPGSTFKIVTAAAALSEKKFRPNDIIYCENGSYKFADIEINDHVKHSYLTFEGVMAYSSNIGFAKIGLSIGKENLYKYSKLFGFGNYTGCNISGEQKGILHTPYSKRWSLTSTPNIAFGQGIAVTALQLINAYSAIANGGTLYEPQIIKEIIDDKNNVLWKGQPQVIRQLLTKEVIEELRNMLSKVVEYGTGKLSKVDGYKVCGKTGTAQKIDPRTRKYSQDKYIASFCGFLPAENAQLSILVLLDEPQTNYWASDVACPVFARIAKEAINYLNITKRENQYEITKITY